MLICLNEAAAIVKNVFIINQQFIIFYCLYNGFMPYINLQIRQAIMLPINVDKRARGIIPFSFFIFTVLK